MAIFPEKALENAAAIHPPPPRLEYRLPKAVGNNSRYAAGNAHDYGWPVEYRESAAVGICPEEI